MNLGTFYHFIPVFCESYLDFFIEYVSLFVNDTDIFWF